MKIGIDMGGTNLRAALIDKQNILNIHSTSCPAGGTEQEVLNTLKKLIKGLMTNEVTGIGAGIPSVVDVEKGIVYNVANIPSWKKVELGRILQEEFSLPVKLNNDSNCFTLGIHNYGEGHDYNDMLGITIGTGIGTGIITNGQLYIGHNTGAGEMGSLPYLDHDYEFYCSSSYFRELGITAQTLSAQVEKGQAEACKSWEIFGQHFGNFIKATMFTYDPEAIILGGGISKGFPYFKEAMWNSIQDYPYPESVKNLKIKVSTLAHAALLGAASLV